jgi:hypothetical protein
MMNRLTHRARRAAGLSATALGLLVGACDNPQDVLLEQQQPQVILPIDAQNATGAIGLYTGALGRYRTALNGGNQNQETLWNFEGLMTDEFKSGDTFSQRNDADQRQTQANDGVLLPTYTAVQQARGRARDAINALKQYAPTETVKIAEMYLELGFMEMTLAQDFCNGVSFGETVNGVPAYTDQLTGVQAYTTAIARFDSALTVLGSDASAAGVNVRNATLVAKGRAQVNLGQFAAAATTVAPVATTYDYWITYSIPTQSNEWWQMGTSSRRYVVGDSADVTGTIKNSLPFASSGDARIKTLCQSSASGNPAVPCTIANQLSGSRKAFDNITGFVEFQNFLREDAAPLLSGLDAQLIIAESKLQSSGTDIAGAFAILNALRAAPPSLSGSYKPAAMAPLTAPATLAAAQDLFFREKAFWQFGRGERLGDMRRMVRLYGRTSDTVYPTGPFHKGGNYGANLSFPIPDNAGNGSETATGVFKGCLDLKA